MTKLFFILAIAGAATPVSAADGKVTFSCISEDGRLRKFPTDAEGTWHFTYEHQKGEPKEVLLTVGDDLHQTTSMKSTLNGPLADVDYKYAKVNYWVEKVRLERPNGKTIVDTLDDKGQLSQSTQYVEQVVLCKRWETRGDLAKAFKLELKPGNAVRMKAKPSQAESGR